MNIIGRFEVAGIKFRAESFANAQVKLDDVLRLVPEPTNLHDPNAIGVYKGETLIGYVPRKDTKHYAEPVAKGTVQCIVEATMRQGCWVRVEVV